MRTWRLIFAFCVAATLSLALPATAATQMVAPKPVRDLLLRHLSLSAPGGEPEDATARVTLERRLRREAGELLATEGYFSPQVELLDSDEGLVLHVEPGPQAHIGSVLIEIRGALVSERRQQLIDAWSLPVAAVFRQADWDNAKQGLLRELMAVDHAGARLLSSQAEVDVETARVDLHLVYDAGARYRYGEIRILGLQRYPATLVERFNEHIRPGQPYRHEDMLAVQAALQNTPFFSSASVELELSAAAEDLVGEEENLKPVEGLEVAEGVLENPQEEALQVPVIIRLRERAPFNIALGAGYSTNTGARVEGNFRNADFLGRAWELDTGARIEQLRQSVYADIFFPPDGQRHRDSVGAVAQHSDIQGLEIQRVALAASRVQLRGSIEQRLGINWRYERQTPNGQPTSINQALTATVGWTWRHANDPLDASEGIVAHLQLAGATKALLSDQNFVPTYFRYSQGIPLGKSDALLLRGELGATAAKSSQGIPQDYLFRAGGTNSVRGYAYQSLGIQEGSATLGAQYLITVSAEYTHWFDSRWGMALFADAGQAADTRDVFKLAPGYGVGARYKSPVGPLAIDVAWGQLDNAVRMSFSLAVPF
ncbi:MAG: outer membrane protein assembly factor [Propionivibrio sp.]|uniref:Outer membrane protein assembly factor n=1 Tax=Candidatus Propionivibrio dominans TaxID=2954373 RepID=A0A9D7FCU0_9RHOO|nr:outer membrane protein assembly factor [Candidatus Propionivibrio dominans]